MKNKFIKELINTNLNILSAKWILERTPFIFDKNHYQYILWKQEISKVLEIDTSAIFLTGSASLGFSLNPNKCFKPYDLESDIDIAVISGHYFDLSWHYLRNLGTFRYTLTPQQKVGLEDHVKRFIYWGTIATDKLLSIFPYGKKWLDLINSISQKQPADGRAVNFRIYKDAESMKAYQINTLSTLREKVLSDLK